MIIKIILLLIIGILFYLVINNDLKINNSEINNSEINNDSHVIILYSITCHEEPLCLLDLIDSCFYHNKITDVKIIVQLNTDMYNYFEKNPIHNKNVYINKNYINNNVAWSQDIAKAHIKNFEYSNKINIKFNYFCLLASNCLFTKDVTNNYLKNSLHRYDPNAKINNILDELVTFITGEAVSEEENNYLKKSGWWWELVNKKMKNLCKFLKKNNVEQVGHSHEGAFYKKILFGKMVNIINSEKLLDEEMNGIPVEEIIFPCLENYFENKISKRLCYIFWESPNFMPTIKEIEDCKYPIVKRVNRKNNDQVRMHYRNKRQKIL